MNRYKGQLVGWYGIIISEKKTGHSFIYALPRPATADFLPLNDYSVEYAITYPSEELAVKSARRVVPKEAYRKHYVYIVEVEKDGMRAVVEVT